MKKISFLIPAAILLLFINISLSDENDSTQTDILITDDGPHLYWNNDTTVTMFYLCNDDIIKRELHGTDTIRFMGMCGDSLQEYTIPIGQPEIPASEYDDVSKILAVSDIHGEYEYLVDILKKAGVIDDGLHWIWGDGHLVIDGDIFDRGDMVTEILWLVYRLEIESAGQGGMVHFLLGNHEKMVIRGDNRYINEKYLKGIDRKMRIRPEDLWSEKMVLGRWLRSRNTAIRINDVLFAHTGLPPAIYEEGISLDSLNDYVRDILKEDPIGQRLDDRVSYFFGGSGPFWYRGYFEAREDVYPQITETQIDSARTFFGIDKIVIGHTGVDSILSMYDGKVIAIDIPFEDIYSLEALLIEDGNYYRIKTDGAKIEIE